MAFLYLVSFFYDIYKDNIYNYAFLSKNEINIIELLQIKNDKIIFYETINITDKIFNKIINLYKGYNIIKITIVNGIYTIYVDNHPIILIEKILQKTLNKNFCNIYINI
jgi:hypothetical protein